MKRKKFNNKRSKVPMKIENDGDMIMRRGRVCWNADRCRQVFELSLMGATESQIARVMDISVKTIELWKRTRPEFLEALKEGREKADAKVAEALFRVACGYEMDEERVVVAKGEVRIVTVKRKFKPDAWAGAKWLALRQRENWAEIQKSETTQTNININKFDFANLSTDELTLIKKIGLKQIMENVRNAHQN